MFKTISLDYDFSEVLSTDHTTHSGTCIGHLRKELADVYDQYQGFPGSFGQDNTTLHQLWWSSDQLDYDFLGAVLEIDIVSISSIMQMPGHTIPYHRDMFHKIQLAYPDRTEKKVRANIFLEDGKLGHLMQFTVNGVHETQSIWKKNTGFVFDNQILHLSCNAGLEPKYTLQISGFYLGQEQ